MLDLTTSMELTYIANHYCLGMYQRSDALSFKGKVPQIGGLIGIIWRFETSTTLFTVVAVITLGE
jgi:hypothetical protein